MQVSVITFFKTNMVQAIDLSSPVLQSAEFVQPEIFATLYAMQSTINTMNEYCTEPQSQATSCNF